jgi:uncharacterized protein YdhG (YjbR/CyaY superfamily)
MKRFAASVQYITGQELEVKAAESRDIVEQELEDLRSRVEELSDEVSFSLPGLLRVQIFRSEKNCVTILRRKLLRSTL